MPTPPAAAPDAWIERRLDGVTDTSMTQRRLSTVERHGGLEALATARARGVHLLLPIDDRGDRIVAASRRAFSVVCWSR